MRTIDVTECFYTAGYTAAVHASSSAWTWSGSWTGAIYGSADTCSVAAASGADDARSSGADATGLLWSDDAEFSGYAAVSGGCCGGGVVGFAVAIWVAYAVGWILWIWIGICTG